VIHTRRQCKRKSSDRNNGAKLLQRKLSLSEEKPAGRNLWMHWVELIDKI